jgi:UDP-N-acetylmuramate dehydrogenase
MERQGIRGQMVRSAFMKRYTSMKVGGPVEYLCYPKDEEDIAAVVGWLRSMRLPVRFLGNGTNVVAADEGLRMGVIRTTRMRHLRFRRMPGGAMVDVSGGLPLKVLINECGRRGLSGLERLYGIPGTVAGAVKMNAGSFGVSVSECLRSVRIADSDGTRTLARQDLQFGYRRSSILDSQCILEASFEVVDGEPEAIRAEMNSCWRQRLEKHPMEYPSAGSVFKNNKGPAWRIIDEAGLRGLRIGGACISEKHPNFIVNMGGATARDIRGLIDVVKKEVRERRGVLLEEEVELWGFDE